MSEDAKPGQDTAQSAAKEIPEAAKESCRDPLKLGATLVKDASGKVLGTNFAVYTHPSATGVLVSLFDEQGQESRFSLHREDVDPGKAKDFYIDGTPCDGIVWHGFIPKVEAGQHYGFRVDGPFQPEYGKTFHKNRLLLDPYAKEVAGYPQSEAERQEKTYLYHSSMFNYDVHASAEGGNDEQKAENRFNATFKQNTIEDTAVSTPKGIVVDTEALKAKYQPGTPLHTLSDSLILETHPREATIAYDKLPDGVKPGTYNAMGSDAFIDWFKGQGYTTLELMPIHLDDAKTHWGYMSSNFFAPNPKYADPDDPRSVTEQFADMVQKLRASGIETWMDVVYNHTAEENHLGAVYSLKGLDERYYRKHHGNFLGAHYYDATGTGNTLNTDHPRVRKLIMDSLEHFHDLGVSGFRFDLMHTLGRSSADGHYDYNHPMFKELAEATTAGGRLEGVKLSGEPWDCKGMAHLPPPIANWNRDFRETLRRASRLPEGIAASSLKSVIVGVGDFIKYAVSHDGLSARDAVSGHGYNHNEDIALDCGGNEDERYRRQTYGIALEALSQGAVMRKMGSDRGHSQNGEHNPYHKDTEAVTQIPWGDKLKPEWKQQEIMDFSGQAMRFKNAHPSLRRTQRFSEAPNPDYKILSDAGDKDITFFDNFGNVLTDDYLKDSTNKAFTYVLSGDTGRKDKAGNPIRDVPVMALINGAPGPAPVPFTIPGQATIDGKPVSWKVAFDSGGKFTEEKTYLPGETINLPPFTAVALEAHEFPGKDKVSSLAERAVNKNFAEVIQARRAEQAHAAVSAVH